MSARVREFEDGISAEVDRWPGATVAFGHAGKHNKATISFGGRTRMVFYPSTPSDCGHGLHNKLKDVRRELRTLWAERTEVRRAPEAHRRRHDSNRPIMPAKDLATRVDRWFGPLAAIKASTAT